MDLATLYRSRGFKSRAAFQRATKISYQTIWRNESGSLPETATLDAYAQALGMSSAEVLHALQQPAEVAGDGAAPSRPPGPHYPVRAIVQMSDGAEAMAIPEAIVDWQRAENPPESWVEVLEVHWDFKDALLVDGDRIFVDGREETRGNLVDGDLILVEHRDPKLPDGLPELSIKRYHHQEGSPLLIPLDPAHENRVFDTRWWSIRGVVDKIVIQSARGRFKQ